MNASTPATPLWARPLPLALILLLLSLPRLFTGVRMGLLPDEGYYAMWSLHLGVGYYDHSPAIAWVVAAGRALFGEGAFPVRSLVLASTFLVFALLYRLGVLLFNDARVGAVAAIFYAVSVGVVLSFSIATPDAPAVLFWLATLWACAEFEARRNPWWWLLAGAFAGLGLLSKYTVLLLGPGVLLWLLSSAERRAWFGIWQLWAGALLAVALFLPVVWWNYTHEWISFAFQFGRSTLLGREHFTSLMPLGIFVVALALILLPPAFIFMLIGTGAWLSFGRTWRPRGLALPVLTTAPMLIYFFVHSFISTAQPHWLNPIFAPLTLIAGWAVVSVRPRAWLLRWPLAALRWLQVPLGLVIIVFASYVIETGTLPAIGGHYDVAYLRGWDDLTRKVSALAAAKGAKWVDTPNFLIGSLLGYGFKTANDPLPILQTNEPFRYIYMDPPPAELLASPHIVLRELRADRDPPPLGGRHLSVETLGRVTRDSNGVPVASYAAYLVTD